MIRGRAGAALRQIGTAVGRWGETLAASVLPDGWAERAVLRRLQHELPPHNIEIAWRLEQRLRDLDDPAGGNRWLHHRWAALFDQIFADLGPFAPCPGFAYACLGAGTRNPLALPFLVALAGADRVWVIEPEPLGEGADWRAGWGLEQMALRVLSGEVRSPLLPPPPARFDAFLDLAALVRHAPLAAVLRPAVTLCPAPVENAAIPDGAVDLVTSRSVLEHVREPARVYDALARVLRPGGVMHHDIDLSSHSGDVRFAFYERPRPRGSGLDTLNELRLSDHVRALEQRGFEVTVKRKTMETPSVFDRGRLQDRFRHYGDEDLLCSRAVVVARKRGPAEGA